MLGFDCCVCFGGLDFCGCVCGCYWLFWVGLLSSYLILLLCDWLFVVCLFLCLVVYVLFGLFCTRMDLVGYCCVGWFVITCELAGDAGGWC